jgi:Uma2 family endonuclease
MTVAEFEDWCALPAQQGQSWELWAGGVQAKMPTQQHGALQARLIVRLGAFIEAYQLGRLTAETRYQALDDSQVSLIPDVAFTRRARLLPIVQQGSASQWPDLVVEIKSPDESYASLREKAAYYLRQGVSVVWVLLPEKKSVEVYQGGREPVVLTAEESLDGGEVLPNFRLSLADLFALP